MQYGGESACTGCRERYATRHRLPPCETAGERCPFSPSPGFEGRLWPDNRLAWWIWERWDHLGQAALDLVELDLSRREAGYLLDKLALLHGLAAAHRAQRRQGDPA